MTFLVDVKFVERTVVEYSRFLLFAFVYLSFLNLLTDKDVYLSPYMCKVFFADGVGGGREMPPDDIWW